MNTEHTNHLPPVEIPLGTLSDEAQQGLVDSFILREGTDYGWNETELSTKRAQIIRQIQKGDVKLVYDPNSESVTLLTLQQWQQLLDCSTVP